MAETNAAAAPETAAPPPSGAPASTAPVATPAPATTGVGTTTGSTVSNTMQTSTGSQPIKPVAGGDQSPYIFWGILLLWAGVFYYFFMRPQRVREKERKAMVDAVQKGDDVVTIGGLHGRITSLDDETVSIKVDEKTGTVLKFSRAAIASVKRDSHGA
jgi:preprotein translocase subunit YajC